jgi:ATP-binding cassette subfamily B protein
MLSDVGQTIQRAAGSLARITELLDEPLTIADGPDAVPLAPVHHELRLERVSFGYDDRPVLRDLSLTIPAGQHVAIVGPSGAGKSTLLNLLLRFWDPTEGRVLVDGQDLRDLQVASLREQIGVVLQDPFIFDTTLRENIALGRPDATDAEIVAAARGARLHEYITSLPAGYDTVVGERGVRMSGGQRQRLAIARALLRQPSLLILDEPTSALDAQTEREILDTLTELAQGRTTISITHRLSLAATADRIFVLADGRLVEQGSHAELVRAGGLYRRMYDEQTSHLTRGPAQDELGHHDDGERDGVEDLDRGSRTGFVPA